MARSLEWLQRVLKWQNRTQNYTYAMVTSVLKHVCRQRLKGNIPKVKLFIMLESGYRYDLFFTFKNSLRLWSRLLFSFLKSFIIVMLIMNTLFERRPKLSPSPMWLCPDWNVNGQWNYKQKCEQLTLGGLLLHLQEREERHPNILLWSLPKRKAIAIPNDYT